MMEIVKCEMKHLKFLLDQDTTHGLKSYAKEESMAATVDSPYSYTCISDGNILLCGGIHIYWPNRGEAWAFFNEKCTPYFMTLHHIVKRYLDFMPIKRIEAAVDVDFKQGHRWVKALGFQKEANVLKSYTPDGKDCSLYSRVK